MARFPPWNYPGFRQLSAISQRDNQDRLGPSAAAGDLHRLLAGQRITGHVLADGPDLVQEVLVAIRVEYQTAIGRRFLGVVRQCVDDRRVLAVDTGYAD